MDSLMKRPTEELPDVPDEDIAIVWDMYSDCCEHRPSEMTKTQKKKMQYLVHMFMGTTQLKSCASLGITPFGIYHMRRDDPAFDEMCKTVREYINTQKIDLLEQQVLDRALDGDRKDSALLAMFAIKARRAEYKDSYSPASDNTVNVRISINGDEYGAKFVKNAEDTE